MKKSLVISTIATVLVVVVALTTATFAWFSSTDTAQSVASFEVSDSGGKFRIFPYELTDASAAGATGAFSSSMTASLDLIDGIGSTTYNTDALGGTVTVGDATTINPTAPKAPLTFKTDDSDAGLPNVQFISAQTATEGKINVTNAASMPIVSRFIVNTAEDAITLNITARLQQPEAQRADMFAAQNFKFLLIGWSAEDNATTQSFVFGTDYSYVTGPSSAPIESTGNVVPTYTPVDISEYYASGAGTIGKTNTVLTDATFPSITTTSLASGVEAKSGDIQMAAGVDVYCTLYVWFDGKEMGDSASSSNLTFTLDFAEPETP